MQFITPTEDWLIESWEGKLERGEMTLDDVRKGLDVLNEELANSSLSDLEQLPLQEIIKQNYTARCSPAFLGPDHEEWVDEFEMKIISRFTKDGYVYFSDGVHALSLRVLYYRMKGAAAFILLINGR